MGKTRLSLSLMSLQPRIPPLMSLNVFPKLHLMYNLPTSKSLNPQPFSGASPRPHAHGPSCFSTSPVTCAIPTISSPHLEPSSSSGKSPSQSFSSSQLLPDPVPCPAPLFFLPGPATMYYPIVVLLCKVFSILSTFVRSKPHGVFQSFCSL